MSQLRLALLVALLVGVLGQSSALKCYVCDYVEGNPDPNNCESDPSDSLLVEITEGMWETRVGSNNPAATSFQKYNSSVSLVQSTRRSNNPTYIPRYKACAKGTYSKDGKDFVSRFGFGGDEEGDIFSGCRTEDGTDEDGTEVEFTLCLCDTNGCNKSNHLNSQIGFIVLISIGTYILNVV